MAYSLDDLTYIMARLRNPDGGCPWDLAQSFQSITASTLEESYELVDAIFADDKPQIKEELGDVLFQVVFYSQLAKEQSAFTLADVIDGLAQKLLRRHPHVFPDGTMHSKSSSSTPIAMVKEQWEIIKQQERRGKACGGLLDDIPQALPALSRAQKMQKRASDVGFDWPDALAAISKVEEELAELKAAIAHESQAAIELEMGDVFFSCVNVARHLGIDSEKATYLANRKFAQRLAFIEDNLAASGRNLATASLIEMDALWDAAKLSEKSA